MTRHTPVRPRRGIAAVEFALYLPLIMLLFGGVVDLSRYMSATHMVVRAARDGARTASATTNNMAGDDLPTATDFETVAIKHVTNILEDSGHDPEKAVITSSWKEVDGLWLVAVGVQYEFHTLVGMLPYLDGHANAHFVMMSQYQPT